MDAETAFKRSTIVNNKANKERKERWEKIKPDFIKKDTDECLRKINKACENGYFNTVCDEYIDKDMFKGHGYHIDQLPRPDSGQVLNDIKYKVSWEQRGKSGRFFKR